MPADRSVLPVDGHAGEIAHVLVGTGQLIEQGGLAAVLVPHQGKGQHRPLGQRVTASLGMEFAFLAQSGVICPPHPLFFFAHICRRCGGHRDLLRVLQPQRQLVIVYPHLQGIPHGGGLHHRYPGAGDHAHVQEVLP